MPIVTDLAKLTIPVVLAFVLTFLLGNRASAAWALQQKRKEIAIASAIEFYGLYGEFFTIWKLWDFAHASKSYGNDSAHRLELLSRASSTEGRIEALLVRLAAERSLSNDELETLGKFRQGFQILRQSIRDEKPLAWRSSENAEYSAFKRLAVGVAQILGAIPQKKFPSTQGAQKTLREITSNRWEATWIEPANG